MEASSRLPRSRDNLFLHSMSKVSPLQGPDTHMPNHNLQLPLIQILTLATFVRNSGAKPTHSCNRYQLCALF